jgi:uncharacterized YigZ family protein
MLFEDKYLTIESPSEGLFKDKGSKFLVYCFPVKNEAEVKEQLQSLKKMHPSANHHCYAYRLGPDKLSFRSSDDGEPSNTAGKPILGQILSNDLTNILIVVVRYFGGTLLGVSGLINAYRQSAAEGIANAKIIERTVNEQYSIFFPYELMNDVMKIIKDEHLDVLSTDFELNCELSFSIRKSKSVRVLDIFAKIAGLKIKYICTV